MARGPAAQAAAAEDTRIVVLMAAADPAGTGADMGAGDPTVGTGGVDSVAPIPTDVAQCVSRLGASAVAALRMHGLGARGDATAATSVAGVGADLGALPLVLPHLPPAGVGADGFSPPPCSTPPGPIPFPWWVGHATHGRTVRRRRVPLGPTARRHQRHYRCRRPTTPLPPPTPSLRPRPRLPRSRSGRGGSRLAARAQWC
jgi:hypothetical protein